MSSRQLTPAQRKQLERVSRDGFERLRRERREFVRALKAEGWTVRELAALLEVHHPQIVQWIHEVTP